MMAFNTNYKDTGLFGVYAVAKPDRLDYLAYTIMYEISKLSYRVSEADVTRACNQLLTYGRRIPLPELFARIVVVDASMIKRVANRFIFDQDVAIAAMGSIKTTTTDSDAEPICSATSFLFINSNVLLLFCLIVLITNALSSLKFYTFSSHVIPQFV